MYGPGSVVPFGLLLNPMNVLSKKKQSAALEPLCELHANFLRSAEPILDGMHTEGAHDLGVDVAPLRIPAAVRTCAGVCVGERVCAGVAPRARQELRVLTRANKRA